MPYFKILENGNYLIVGKQDPDAELQLAHRIGKNENVVEVDEDWLIEQLRLNGQID